MTGNEDKVSIVHVTRPNLPWRVDDLTECGLPAAGHPVISRDEFLTRLTKFGKQRTAMTTCMTCFNTAFDHPTWNEDPVKCIAREVRVWYGPRTKRFKRELLAIAALVARHREEFDELMKDQEEIVPLDAGRHRKAPAKPKAWER